MGAAPFCCQVPSGIVAAGQNWAKIMTYTPAAAETIGFDDFLKVDIRAGTIVACDELPEARKPAYRLRIDFGAAIGVKNHRPS